MIFYRVSTSSSFPCASFSIALYILPYTRLLVLGSKRLSTKDSVTAIKAASLAEFNIARASIDSRDLTCASNFSRRETLRFCEMCRGDFCCIANLGRACVLGLSRTELPVRQGTTFTFSRWCTRGILASEKFWSMFVMLSEIGCCSKDETISVV